MMSSPSTGQDMSQNLSLSRIEPLYNVLRAEVGYQTQRLKEVVEQAHDRMTSLSVTIAILTTLMRGKPMPILRPTEIVAI